MRIPTLEVQGLRQPWCIYVHDKQGCRANTLQELYRLRLWPCMSTHSSVVRLNCATHQLWCLASLPMQKHCKGVVSFTGLAHRMNFPLVTSALHAGVGSDVDKVAEYRAFARMRRAFPQSYTSYEMGNFSRFLIKVSSAQTVQTSGNGSFNALWRGTSLLHLWFPWHQPDELEQQ